MVFKGTNASFLTHLRTSRTPKYQARTNHFTMGGSECSVSFRSLLLQLVLHYCSSIITVNLALKWHILVRLHVTRDVNTSRNSTVIQVFCLAS